MRTQRSVVFSNKRKCGFRTHLRGNCVTEGKVSTKRWREGEASVSRICLHSGARSPRFVLSRLLLPSPSLSLFEEFSRISPSRGTTQSCGKAAVQRRANIQSRESVSSETTQFYNAKMACFPETFGTRCGCSLKKLYDTIIKIIQSLYDV